MLIKSVILTCWHLILISNVLGSVGHQTRFSEGYFQYVDNTLILQ